MIAAMHFKRILVALTTALAGWQAAAAETIWIEAERFEDCGGWVNDAQFIDQMGSPYLLAIGIGTPVKDAVTRVNLPRAGRWRLWARTRDWAPEHHPGRFQILLNGKPAARDFGASGKVGWCWEDGGVHELSGRVGVRLHDLTGYYGRCDVIVLTDDVNWTPPDDKAAIAALRERHGGVSREVRNAGDYDVVVVGGGLAGCLAAVSSARMGVRTALIQDRPILGGNASTEILVPPVGVWPGRKGDPREPYESGVIEEAGLQGKQRFIETRYWSSRLKRLVSAEPNLNLRLNTHATGVELKPGTTNTIAAVLTVDARSGERQRFGGRAFVDCTGDGVVGVAAGAAWRMGREPRSMYNESMAPEVGNATTMGNSLKYYSAATDTPQPFATPPWAMKFESCDSFPPKRHPPRLGVEMDWQWMLELGGTRDTYRDKEEIRDDVLRLIYGIWGHIKNHCTRHKEAATRHKLTWVGHVAGTRESMRLLGDCVFTENDMVNQTLFPDRVAFGAWGLDDHFSEGFLYSGLPSRHPHMGRMHSVPYRSLYSTNVVNLLMAGRNISASHVGMGTTRVMMTCGVIGQAAGTAAAMCVQRNVTARGLYHSYLEDLQQQLLKDGAYIIDLPNTDPRDLARKAKLSASSEGTDRGEPAPAASVINGRARAEAGKGNAWMPRADAAGPHWVELAWPQPVAFNVVHVTFQTGPLSPKSFAVEAWQDGAWKPLAKLDDNHRRRHVLGLNRVTASKLRVVLGEPRGICEIRVYDEPERVVETARRAARTQDVPDTDAGFPWEPPGSAPPLERPKAEVSKGIPLDVAAKKFGGILLDASQAMLKGDWGGSTHSTPFIGEDYLTDGNSDKGAKEVCFKPDLPKAGSYEVRLAYTALNNRASNVPVTIRTSRGEKKVLVNQRRAPEIGGLFHSLGRFDLDAGNATSIVISNTGTDGFVIVDALQIVP
ncbi:MAG: FAD-dependent oxidoreductase [Verrucomicrobia bacterium]|nr:FAD-dependent oxidoreductase [Verrucomicrobiota bacterium]